MGNYPGVVIPEDVVSGVFVSEVLHHHGSRVLYLEWK